MAAEEKFLIIVFLDDTGQAQIIDCVPTYWIVYNELMDHLVAPFPSELTKTNVQLLNVLVRSGSKPLDSWPYHRIEIKGSATTFAEAEIKIKDLKTKSHIFSTDDENHAAAKERDIAKKYKLKRKAYDNAKVHTLLEKSEVDLQTNREPAVNKKDSTTPAKLMKKQPEEVSKTVKSVLQATMTENARGAIRKCDLIKNPQDRAPLKQMDQADECRSECGRSHDTNCEPSDNNSDSQETDDQISNQYGAGGEQKSAMIAERNTNLDDLKSMFLKSYQSLSAQMGQVLGQLTDLKICQNELNTIMLAMSDRTVVEHTGVVGLTEKHGVGPLPFQKLSQFDAFDTKLKLNLSLRSKIIVGMLLHVSIQKPLIISVHEIIKKFMTPAVLINFTAVKQSGEKKVLKDTTFYLCLRDAVLVEFQKNPRVSPIKEKDIQEAIGSVIANCRLGRLHEGKGAQEKCVKLM